MKRLLLILTILTSGVVSSQSFNFECPPVSLPASFNSIDFDSKIGTVTNTMYQITDMFLEDFGVDKNDYEIEMIFKAYTEENPPAAEGLFCGTLNGKHFVQVTINSDLYHHFDNNIKKLFLMYHELGHSLLSYQHVFFAGEIMTEGYTEENGFKFPTAYPVSSLDIFLRARTRMFNGENQNPYNCYSSKGSRTIEDIFN